MKHNFNENGCDPANASIHRQSHAYKQSYFAVGQLMRNCLQDCGPSHSLHNQTLEKIICLNKNNVELNPLLLGCAFEISATNNILVQRHKTSFK